jgi:hypothetical protein
MRANASGRRSENRPALQLQRRYSNTKKDPVPEGRGEIKNIFTSSYVYDSISFAMPDTFCSVWTVHPDPPGRADFKIVRKPALKRRPIF